MHVQSIVYKPIEGGTLGGHFALHVTLGGGDAASVLSPTDLVTKIHQSLASLKIKASIKGVLIDFRGASEPAEDMMSLLGVLRDWGLFINLWVGESTRYPWFEYASSITVFVTSRHWPNFRVSEIRYVLPDDAAEWEEPEIYESNAKAICYVASWSKGPEVLRFITDCSRPWGLIHPTGVGVTFKL